MKRVLGILAFSIIFVISIVDFSFAAEEITMKIENNKSVAKPGDEIEFTISALNSSSNEIMGLGGAFEFDDTIFEPVTLDYDEAIEEADSIMATILKEMKDAIEGKECKLLSVENDWCITLVEEEGVYAFAAISVSNPLKKSTTYTEMGTIKLKVKSSANSTTEKIELTTMEATTGNDSSSVNIEIEDVSSQSITINGGDNSDVEDIPSLDPEDDEEQEEEEEQSNTPTNNATQQDPQQADTDAPDTGIEDVIPFIVIATILGFIGYIKYSKYQGI